MGGEGGPVVGVPLLHSLTAAFGNWRRPAPAPTHLNPPTGLKLAEVLRFRIVPSYRYLLQYSVLYSTSLPHGVSNERFPLCAIHLTSP